ncbi:DUF4430 domain-containing protein [Cohnella pontilimi]|uniref:DUF4430 domain-containing protein n=1 Tax=Cohnella pontilimi TaxID=2564100 RepID=UPI00145FB322|nr:DUF4430 domain-containing protein [Cohnella pontilimi]
MAKRWRAIVKAAGMGVVFLFLMSACTEQGQVPSDVPPATPAVQSGGESSASPHETNRSRISEPGPSPSAVSPDTPQPAQSTATASPSERPSDSSPASGSEASKPKPEPSASPSPAPKPASPSPAPAAKEITLSVAGNAEWGTILTPEKVALKTKDTVADLLIRTLKAHKLAYEKRGSGALFYVVGIDGLYEFDDGPTSGWKYRVNGKEPGEGAGSVEPKPGDRIEWFYTSEDADALSGGKGSAP